MTKIAKNHKNKDLEKQYNQLGVKKLNVDYILFTRTVINCIILELLMSAM